MKRLVVFALSYLLLTVCASADDSANDSCYNEIKKNLRSLDYVRVKQTNGREFNGYVKKIDQDSLTIKMQMEKIQTPVLLTLDYGSIDTLFSEGISKRRDFLTPKVLAPVGGMAGFLIGYLSIHDINRNYETHTDRLILFTLGGSAAGALLGFLLKTTIVETPVSFEIKCN